MTTTSTQYAQTITQGTGATYSTWTNIDKLKKQGGNAITQLIGPSTNVGASATPAPLVFTDFGLSVPSGAEVRKLIIEYKQEKSRAKFNEQSGKYVPCTPTECKNTKSCAIPAPTVILKQKTNSDGSIIGNASQIISNLVNYGEKKGQAPTETTKTETLTFDFSNGAISPQTINNLAIQWNYGTNTSKKYGGFVRLYYIRVKIEYALPNYAIKAESGFPDKTVYDKDEYSLSVSCSDSNITRKTQSITITSPSGFSFKGAWGNGKVVQNQTHAFTWTPDMKAGSANVELLFDVNVSFSSGDTSVPKTFNIAMQSAGLTGSHTITVYKRTAPIGQDTDTGEQSFDYDTQSPTLPETKLVTVDEEFEYTLTIDDITWDGIIQTIYAYGI